MTAAEPEGMTYRPVTQYRWMVPVPVRGHMPFPNHRTCAEWMEPRP